MANRNNNRTINAYEVYYRKNGEKRSKLLNNVREVNAFRRSLTRNKRKFLGSRELQLVEVA
jgi:hypothetical protein